MVQIAGTDTTQLAQDVLNSGTVNEAEGWVSGFDPTILQTAQATAQTSLETYITNNMTDPTVGDVIGGRRTIVQNYPVLAASLANKIIATGTRYDQLPSNLQQQVSYRFLQNTSSQTNTPVTFAWASVNNEKVTLSFTPATADDEAALQSLLPEGEITDISQLPSSISAYLIEVIPELKVNGVVQLTGTPMKLGEGLDFHTNIKHPGRASEINYTYNIPAGSFVSVNTVAGNVSSAKLTNLQSQLTQTQTALESTDPTQAQSLTREDILGDMFYTGTLGYFAQLIGFTQIGALQANTQFYLSAGYGTFGYEPKVSYSFGYPISISAGGVTLDIPLNVVTASNSNNQQEEINYKLQAGIIASALEHATPEQLFNTDPTNPPNAFSAVKGLQLAAAEGQRIYQITQANQATTLPNLNLDAATETEITNAVNAGKEVITHTDLVSVPGYAGAGYIIIDPVSGDGAYKISGGLNGGTSSDVGITDFVYAVVEQPGMLIPKCQLPFMEQVIENFLETNKTIIGLAAPKGLTLLTGGAVAAAGGFTLLEALKLSVVNSSFIIGNIFVALMMTLINTILVNFWFEVGVAAGSIISASICKRE